MKNVKWGMGLGLLAVLAFTLTASATTLSYKLDNVTATVTNQFGQTWNVSLAGTFEYDFTLVCTPSCSPANGSFSNIDVTIHNANNDGLDTLFTATIPGNDSPDQIFLGGIGCQTCAYIVIPGPGSFYDDTVHTISTFELHLAYGYQNISNLTGSLDPVSTPEPSSLALLGGGLIVLVRRLSKVRP